MNLQFIERESRTENISAGETASWYYRVETKPGAYEARCVTISGRDCDLADAYWVLVKVDGTCVGGWLPGYRCNAAEKDFGTPMTYNIQVYGYQVRNALEEAGSPWRVAS
jgi:hypothetical protein